MELFAWNSFVRAPNCQIENYADIDDDKKRLNKRRRLTDSKFNRLI